jgi:lipid-A-disaccharide synthase-like uncharacterized protein
MIIDFWTVFGMGGNFLYSARVLVQWIASEKAKKSIAPRSFWWISLAACFILIIYSIVRSVDKRMQDKPPALPLLAGYIITLVPYLRNLMLSYNIRLRWHIASYVFALLVFLICLGLLLKIETPLIRSRWFIVGAAGSIIWNTRFLWQWAYSERVKKSVFPISFWYLSFLGWLLNLLYSLAMQDLVYILGFIFNFVPITRNIMLYKKHTPVLEQAGVNKL